MGNLVKYVGSLAALSAVTNEETQQEIFKALSLDKMTNTITSGMGEINKAIDDIRGPVRISFNLGDNKFSLNDLYVYFSNKVATVWNSGGIFQTIISIILFVFGVVSLLALPLVTTIKYIVKGIKDKAEFRAGLRSFLMKVGVEASAGIILILFFVRIISL